MKTATRRACLQSGAAAFALAASAGAWAQSSDDAWQYEVGPSAWATGVSGTMRPSGRAPVAHFNNSQSDLKLNAGSFSAEAIQGRWGILLDITGIDQSHDSNPLQHGQPGKTSPDGSFNLAQLAVAYRLSYDPDTHFDILAGVRYNSLDLDVTQPPSVAPASCVKCTRNQHWTDGIGGFRVERKLTNDWWLTAYADYGGGGSGSNSTWQALLGASYLVDDGITARFGYRVLSVDYEQTQLLYNLKTSGIYAGVAMRF
jgi:opacity protein-like surface antigen